MYNNVLFANWTAGKLRRTLICGNSFSDFLNQGRGKAVKEVEFVEKSRMILKEKKCGKFKKHENAFSDMSVQWFETEGRAADFWKNSDIPPSYGEVFGDTIF